MKHTKGEWRIDPSNKISIIDSHTEGFNNLIAQTNGKKGQERDANAKLIAAAPDLLEFVIRMVSESNFIDESEKTEAIELIQKATA